MEWKAGMGDWGVEDEEEVEGDDDVEAGRRRMRRTTNGEQGAEFEEGDWIEDYCYCYRRPSKGGHRCRRRRLRRHLFHPPRAGVEGMR